MTGTFIVISGLIEPGKNTFTIQSVETTTRMTMTLITTKTVTMTIEHDRDVHNPDHEQDNVILKSWRNFKFCLYYEFHI